MAIPNSIENVIAFLAVGLIGAVAAPLNFAYKYAEFEFYINDSQAGFLIVSSVGNPIGEEVATKHGLKIIELYIDHESNEAVLWDKSSGSRPIGNTIPQESGNILNALPDEICLLLHTSGTTSRPKAVPLTHDNLCTTIRNIIMTYDLNEIDVTILVMPLFHVHGLICALLSTMGSGGHIVIPKDGKFSASSFWVDSAHYKITWFTAVPTIHQVIHIQK